ncbi:hypothetical protein [Reyranella sp.]|uniref:hypothetical protein n=1 Tax=Reyranella sp. TaxID=1929291 RepID=UPI003D0ECACC
MLRVATIVPAIEIVSAVGRLIRSPMVPMAMAMAMAPSGRARKPAAKTLKAESACESGSPVGKKAAPIWTAR